MRDYNGTLNDEELRGLLKTFMMEGDEEDVLTQQMIEMESKIAFGVAPLAVLPLGKETEMMNQLTKKLAAKSGWQYWAAGIGVTAIATTAIVLQLNKNPQEQNNNVQPVQPIEQNDPVKKQPAPGFVPNEKTGTKEIQPLVALNDNNTSAENLSTPAEVKNENSGEIKKENITNENKTNPEKEKAEFKNNILSSLLPFDPAKNKKKESQQVINVDTIFNGVKRVEMNMGPGDITVNKGKTDKVIFKGQITENSKKDKHNYGVHYDRDGDVLKISVEFSDKSCRDVSYVATFDMEVPEGTELKIRNGNGLVKLNGLDGKTCEVENSYGNIIANNISGEIKLVSVSGNIQLTNASGNVKLDCSYGHVTADQVKGNLKVFAGSGNVRINTVTGTDFYAENTYGDITLSNITAEAKITASSGNITLNNMKGNVKLTSLYGNQKIQEMTGNLVSTSTSGHVTILKLKGDIKVNSNYGNISTDEVDGNMTVASQSGNIKGKNIQVSDLMDLQATYGDIYMQLRNKTDDLSFDLKATTGDLNIKKEGINIKSEDGKLLVNKGKVTIKGITYSGSQVYE